MRNQKGAVLIVSMILLFVLTLLATATMSTSNMEVQMASNYQASHRAFQWAENGLADSRDYLANNFSTAAVGDTDTLTMNGRTFDWEIIQGYDEAAMGVGQTGFMVRSIGTFSNSTRIVNAIYAQIERPVATASALSLHPAGSVTLQGNATISGLNWNVPIDPDCNGAGCEGTLSGTDDTIGVYSDTNVGDLTETGSTTLEGAPATQNGGGACDQACWVSWANNISTVATVHNGAEANGTINWGTRDNPVIHVIDQNMAVGASLDSFGILIVNDASLVINANFHHEGLIVAIGNNVDLIIGGTARIFGSVVAASPSASIDVGATGTPGIFYSLEALGNLDTLVRVRQVAWFEEVN